MISPIFIAVLFNLVTCQTSTIFSSMPGSFVISSVDDQIKSAVGEIPIPWNGFAVPDQNRKPPLYGLTYFPWRTKIDCSNITAVDIESDVAMISELAGSIYIYELFCDFGPLLVNLTRHYNMSILIGIPLNNDSEFQRQRRVLRNILTTPRVNLSHIVAISVGHLELGSIIASSNLTDAAMEKLKNITAIVDTSPYPDIPVTTADTGDNLFRRKLYYNEQIYIGSYNTMETLKNASVAAALLYEGLFQLRNLHPETDDDSGSKPIILTDIGWASDGYFDPKTSKKNVRPNSATKQLQKIQVTQSDQLEFLNNLHCPQLILPPMYYVHSAFDLTWKYDANDSAAHWGLADAKTRRWKPNVKEALMQSCQSGSSNLGDGQKTRYSKGWTLILVAVCSVLGVIFLAMCIMVLCFWRWKRDAVRKLKMTQMEQLEFMRNASTTSAVDSDSNRYVNDVTKFNTRWDDYLNMLEPDYEDLSFLVAQELRIDLSQLELREIVGEGHFGIVQRATYHMDGATIEVAVKRLHVGARNVHQFLMEGIKMQKFNHPNVLNLIGISFTPTNMPMIITPYLDKGDVLEYIRKPERVNIPLRQLVDFCYQISEGMRYLHNLKMIHRDLAARNCMLDKELTVKIADFGLCRDISDCDSYQTTKAFELPIRWMPPESIEQLQWTGKSDVWSYGVVMWEVISRGQQPYKDVALIELRAYLKNGGRLPKPLICPDIIYEIMKTCWHIRPNFRPNFSDLCQVFPILLHSFDRGDKVENIDYSTAIMPLITSCQIPDNVTVESSPQVPSAIKPVSSIRRAVAFTRNIFTNLSMHRHRPNPVDTVATRKNSV